MDRVLHAGFHKTGSTFLQKRFFPFLQGVDYHGSFGLNKGPVFNGVNNVLLFSNEASCGYPCPYAHKFSLDRLATNVDILSVEKIIIVRREFYSWVLSLYFQTLNEGFCWSLKKFVLINKDGLLSWRYADAAIQDWCVKCGKDLLIIDYEKLLSDPDRVLKKMSCFIGAKNFPAQTTATRDNQSRKGVATIFLYRMLNFLAKPRFSYGLMRLFKLTPRRIISGKFGLLIDRLSMRSLSPQDIEALF